MIQFDPNAAAAENSGIFGLPYRVEDARLVILPIPWEVTTSYGGGTSQGPQIIFRASKQVDLFDGELGNFYQAGIAMIAESAQIQQWNATARQLALQVIAAQSACWDDTQTKILTTINAYSDQLNHYVYTETKKYLSQGKLVGMVGGDHSTPFGGIQALLEKYPHLGILHIDAHADMRKAFEGFEHSHASIMYNVIEKTPLSCLVQVGIRDFCEEEFDFIQKNKDRVYTFFDWILFEQKTNGVRWTAMCDEIIMHLPHEVYISFDIDGLDPRFCPHTGTPVPGGLDFYDALYLLKKVVNSGRKIIGFDLNEVSPGGATQADIDNPAAEWDANVGARLLYKLCGWTLCSNGTCK